MPRFYQLLFSFSVLSGSWLAMMGVHELGHVIGGVLTGGTVSGVVMHPLMISRTDLSVNPHPAVVVWAGPLLGVLLPLVLLLVARKLRWSRAKLIQFFAGFCLIANGAYIAGGSWEGIGDCSVMHQTGTPLWLMWGFGLLTVPVGFYLWHRLGTLQDWWRMPESMTPRAAWSAFLILGAMIVLMELFSAR
ncbi:MAG: M50 family metallopeptidase [Gimesia sp.]|nr:M50 family metallopeptidase [Gimesia sp.]